MGGLLGIRMGGHNLTVDSELVLIGWLDGWNVGRWCISSLQLHTVILFALGDGCLLRFPQSLTANTRPGLIHRSSSHLVSMQNPGQAFDRHRSFSGSHYPRFLPPPAPPPPFWGAGFNTNKLLCDVPCLS